MAGGLDGSGSLAWSQSDFHVGGRVEGRGVGSDLLTVPHLVTEFAVDPGQMSVKNLQAEIFGGVVAGSARAPLTDLDAPIEGQLSWSGLDLAALPVVVPDSAAGRVSGQAVIGGTVSRPEGDLSVVWETEGSHPVADRLQLDLNLADGVVRAVIQDTSTRAGSISARAEVPLRDIERPSWLWPDAEGGSVTGTFCRRTNLFSDRSLKCWRSIPWAPRSRPISTLTSSGTR